MESEKKRLDNIKQLDKDIFIQEKKYYNLLSDVRKIESISAIVKSIISSVNDLEKKLS